MTPTRRTFLAAVCGLHAAFAPAQEPPNADPLPLWNDGMAVEEFQAVEQLQKGLGGN
ncbi:MAG TPA: hypothetical protein VIL46_16945 [Gemmataceae bacterium]